MSSETQMRARRQRVIGRLFTRLARSFQQRATAEIQASGFPDYRLGDNSVLIHLEREGTRISELATRAGMTKQGMSQLVRDLEKRGYVEKRPDPTDGRAQCVFFTTKGDDLLSVGVAAVESLDKEIGEYWGESFHEEVRDKLTGLLLDWDERGF